MKVAKVFAILSVIIAHSHSIEYGILSTILFRLGSLGVITFLVVAGYFYNANKYGFRVYFRRKLITIVIPWIFTGSILFIWGNYPNPGLNIYGWINWIIGNGTYLYYMSVLMVCYVVFYFSHRKSYLYSIIVLNLISLILTSFGLLNILIERYFGLKQIYDYLNIFNWMGYFACGILLKGHMGKFLIFAKSNRISLFALYIIFLTIGCFVEPKSGGYFSKLAIPMQLIGMTIIMSLSTINLFNRKFMYILLEYTFAIYLTHFMVFPIRRILFHNEVFEFINPLIFLIVNASILILGQYVSSYFQLNKTFNSLLGIRQQTSYT